MSTLYPWRDRVRNRTLARMPNWTRTFYWKYIYYPPWLYAKWFLQRHIRGWDNRVLWGLDQAVFVWLLPPLRAHRDTFHGTPIHPTRTGEDGNRIGYTTEEWRAILDEIIWALEWIVENEWPHKDYHEEYRRVMRGYGLFVKWLPAMWD